MRKQVSTILLALLPFVPSCGQQVLSNSIRQMEYTDSLSSVVSSCHFDGLGRAYAQVDESQSPAGGDIVTFKSYDGRGHVQREWLPVCMPSTQVPPDVTEVAAIATSSSAYSDASPFTDYAYEPSPSGRIVSLTGPGSDWRTHGKSMDTSYSLNLPADVIRFGAAYGGMTLTAAGYYAPGELDKMESIGEDGLVSSEYTDLFGRKVMTERGGLRTYYVYDNASNLRFVLPPALDGVLHVGNSYNLLTCQPLHDYAYFYAYDKRGLCIERKLPGCDPVTMVYDDGGRMAFSQDGCQRSSGDWTFTLYDNLGRIVVTGIHRSSTTPVMTGVLALATYTGEGPLAGYATDVGLTVGGLLTVCYYDNYDFLLHHAMADSMRYRLMSSYDEAVGVTPGETYRTRGLLTGTVTYLLKGSDSITEAIYYDAEGRRVQSHRRNVRGGWEHNYHRLNAFTGDLLAFLHEHSASGYSPVTENITHTYDGKRRLLTTTHSINGCTPVTLASYTYDAVGRVSSKTVGGLETTSYTYNVRSWPTKISGQRFTERLCYNAPVEGLAPGLAHQYRWNGTVAAYAWLSGSETLQRGYSLLYDGLDRLTTANYGEGPSLESYHTKYDEKAEYDCMGNPTWIYRRSPDVINDIRPSSPSDRLRLEYEGNQLVHVTDSVTSGHDYSGAFHFEDGADETVEYEYDANGNMTKDLNRNITEIRYNLLNLPSMIAFGDNTYIYYTYSATGEKLTTRYAVRFLPMLAPGGGDPSSTEAESSGGMGDDISGSGTRVLPSVNPSGDMTKHYCGNVVYDSGERMLLTDEGYVTFAANGTPQYHYYLKDHLGNVRVVMGQAGAVEQVNHYYAFGSLMRESNSPGVQPYKYGGKELDRYSGLDAYDFGARAYFSDRMQWSTMDPLSEKYYSISPYVYCEGNPVRLVDPNGREVRDGLGSYNENNKDLKQLTQYLASHNDPNSIIIVAHGIYKNKNDRFASSIDIQTYNTETGEWNHNKISNGKQLNDFLSKYSKTWNNYKNGKISADDLHIVFYSCGSAPVVQEMSKDEAFKDVTFIAPNKKIQYLEDKQGNWHTTVENTKWKKSGDGKNLIPIGRRDFGTWQIYKNGENLFLFSNYSGKKDLLPGTKGFDYFWSRF